MIALSQVFEWVFFPRLGHNTHRPDASPAECCVLTDGRPGRWMLCLQGADSDATAVVSSSSQTMHTEQQERKEGQEKEGAPTPSVPVGGCRMRKYDVDPPIAKEKDLMFTNP